MKFINTMSALAGLGLLLGCDASNDSNSGASADSQSSGMTQGATTDEATNAPNNTGINERDRSEAALTPMDQGGSQADLDITTNIRQAVTKDDFSTDAKNIKIITVNGKVTLRGPVRDAQEKQAIEAAVKSVAGVATVDNQLEPKQQSTNQ